MGKSIEKFSNREYFVKRAIRDDDTNYFTQPEDLVKVYGKVWNKCPISLSVIPFQKMYKKRSNTKKILAR